MRLGYAVYYALLLPLVSLLTITHLTASLSCAPLFEPDFNFILPCNSRPLSSALFCSCRRATQFGSALADIPLTSPDTKSTTDGRAVSLNVLLNDFNVDAGLSSPFVVGQARTGDNIDFTTLFLSPSMDLSDVLSLLAPLTILGKAVVTFGTEGVLVVTPTVGFVGDINFFYAVDDSAGHVSLDLSTGAVTITVGADVKLSFLIPKAVSTKDAIGTVRGGLLEVASVTAGNPNFASLDAVLDTVTDVYNFVNNTSFAVVTETFNSIFADFFDIFRGGNFLGGN